MASPVKKKVRPVQEELARRPERIYYVNPLLLRGHDDWSALFAHARQLGFDSVLSSPLFARGAQTSVFVARSFEEIDPVYELGTSVEQAVGGLARATAAGARSPFSCRSPN